MKNLKVKRIIFFLVCILLLSYVHSESESASFDFSLLKGIEISEESEINDVLNKTDMTFFAFYYKKQSLASNQIAAVLQEIQKSLEYLAETMLIDCDKESLSTLSQCNPSNVNENDFVYFEVYEPPLYKFNPYTKAINAHTKKLFTKNTVNGKALFNFITHNIISRAQKVTNENYNLFISNSNMNKFILFTDKPKTPLLFRGISNYYYDQILFGEVNSVEKELIKKLEIKEFPTLMLYQSHEDGVMIDDPQIEIYKGEKTAQAIVKYLKDYALKEKLYSNGKKTSNSNSQYDLYFKKLTTDKIKDFFEKNKEKNVVLYLDNKELNDKDRYSLISDDIKEFNTQTHGFFIFGQVDCNGKENDKICSSMFKFDEYPATVLFKAKKTERGENDIDNEVFYSTIEERINKGAILLSKEYIDIQKEINSIYEGNFREANQHTMNSILSQAVSSHKIPIIYMFDSYVQLGISLMSLEEKYKNIFEWIVYDNPPSEFTTNLGVQTLPALAIAIPDENSGSGQIKMLRYSDLICYSKIKSFLSQTFKFENKNNKKEEKEETTTNIEPIRDFIQNTQDLVTTCTKKKLCMIAFFDMRTVNEEIINNYEEKMKIYENVTISAVKRPISFGYVNATCQAEFASKFGIDLGSLPNVVIYSYNKDVFTNFIGAFQKEDIEEFITKTITGRVNFQKIQKENAILGDIKCEEIHEVATEDDDDEFMKELLEEERKKREAFEAERGDEEKKKKKKRKKKNKKKKDEL